MRGFIHYLFNCLKTNKLLKTFLFEKSEVLKTLYNTGFIRPNLIIPQEKIIQNKKKAFISESL